MKRKIFFLMTVFLLAIGSAGVASAIPFVDLQTGYDWLGAPGEQAVRTFDLNSDSLLVGDINAEDDILPPVALTVFFTDDERDSIFNPFTWEFANLSLDGVTSLPFSIDAGFETYFFGVWLAVVNDHYLSVTFTNVYGDFGVGNASLSGQYIDNASVPEPATMILLGTGLIGLAVSSRKKLFEK